MERTWLFVRIFSKEGVALVSGNYLQIEKCPKCGKNCMIDLETLEQVNEKAGKPGIMPCRCGGQFELGGTDFEFECPTCHNMYHVGLQEFQSAASSKAGEVEKNCECGGRLFVSARRVIVCDKYPHTPPTRTNHIVFAK